MFEALGKYAVFSGRAGRKEYWLFQILIFIINFIGYFIIENTNKDYGVIIILINLALLVPNIAVSSRRMHDMDKNGAWAIFAVIPVASLGFMIAACFDGTAGVNQYGPDPKGRGNSFPGGSGDNGAQDTAGTAEARPVQREHRFAGLVPGDIYTNDEGVPTTLTQDVFARETKPHLKQNTFDDFPHAADRLRLAVKRGHNEAQYVLGGDFPKNNAVAAKWLLHAAGKGDAEAQFSLGLMYYFGEGVEQDYAEAAKWYRLAAEQGNAEAQFSLGMMYFGGKGVPENFFEAAKFWWLAAGQGHAEAQDRWNEMCGIGEDIEQDHVNPKPIEGGGSGLQSKSPDIHSSKAVDDDLKIHLKELKSLHEEGMIDDDEYKSLKGRALGL